MKFRFVKSGGPVGDSSNFGGDDRFQAVLGAVYTALRPYPEACAAVERSVVELLGALLYSRDDKSERIADR